MILVDREIISLSRRGNGPPPLVSPLIEENVQPASIDVRLGNRFRVFEGHDTRVVDLGDPASYEHLTHEVVIDDGKEFVLHPEEFALGHTIEEVSMPNNLVARIEGKSSLGRLGLIVHATAGFIDPGFHGDVTLEMKNLSPVPIILRPGKLIAQISFHLCTGPVDKPYNGRYQGDKGVAPSRYGIGHPERTPHSTPDHIQRWWEKR